MHEMAEAPTTATTEEDKSTICPICLDAFVHPAMLPCGHIFCYLCIKGTSMQNQRCAMCRQLIPSDYVENPNLIESLRKLSDGGTGAEKKKLCCVANDEAYRWYYEGQNGWWQYDDRTNNELEAAYNAGEMSCELLIAGMLYIVDFDANLQLRKNNPARRRRIKRDLATIDKKGIAGLRDQTCVHNHTPDATTPNDSIQQQQQQQQHRRIPHHHVDSTATETNFQRHFSVRQSLHVDDDDDDGVQRTTDARPSTRRRSSADNATAPTTTAATTTTITTTTTTVPAPDLNSSMLRLNFDDD